MGIEQKTQKAPLLSKSEKGKVVYTLTSDIFKALGNTPYYSK